MKFYWFVGIALALHFILALKTQLMINKTVVFNRFQKRFNSVCSWLIPFVWSFIVRYMLKESDIKVMTKPERKKLTKAPSANGEQSVSGSGDNGYSY